ncbi:hypothetical protein [Methylobacterium frigidaeris]|uniref:Secreted protein n=1 Tax=Methylobacterium frigidaeris TaxID=2038277 RepID=A0AA37HG42_9HYPH|nr:hypothetical protein [Methylobacterium frigidaeris]PIK69242.1 hypothetical protein CS379_30860 [Methylobacterium frigidaeris]GJD64911.1 hypothetical protein MPEAHAMD_5096 [Methylobacterium frigidaeris]
MPTRLTCLALFSLAVALPLGWPVPAAAGPAQDYQYQRRQTGRGQFCRPPLKFAAGACVRRCPAGYQDNGGYCRLRNMQR